MNEQQFNSRMREQDVVSSPHRRVRQCGYTAS